MEFTKATYRRAIRLAENEVYSRADILQRAKDNYGRFIGNVGPENYWDAMQAGYLEDSARTEYFKSLDLLGAIKDRAKREGKLK